MYQEVGRGGRDGHQALALCLWCAEDIRTARSLTTKAWLTPEKAEPRWRALLDSARLRVEDGTQIYAVSLDAAHEGLSSRTGTRNQDWNRNLLNLLQRAGAIEILSVTERGNDGPVWNFRVLDLTVLRGGAAALEPIMRWRDAEQDETERQLTTLQRLVERPEDSCFLVSLFEQVEAGDPIAPYCGRCTWCQSHDVHPPKDLHFCGLDNVWPKANRSNGIFPTGTSIVHPKGSQEEDFLALVPLFLQAGFQQFLVQDGRGDKMLECLRNESGLGLTLESSMILRGNWLPSKMPTAAFLVDRRPQNEQIIRWIRDHVARNPSESWVLVAPPWMDFQQRALSVLSSLPPIDIGQFEQLVRKGLPPT